MVEGPNDVLVPLGASTADSFLEQLGPQSPLWQPDPAKWIFRGQADSAWKLLAKAHRGLSAFAGLGLDEILANPEVSDRIKQQEAENDLLGRFHAALDAAGLPIPTENPKLSPDGATILGMHEVHPSGLPLLALAQHYGLPTSLLDWTRHAFKAAYFAAADAAQGKGGDTLVVWALRVSVLDAGVYSYNDPIRLVTAPLASNPNLRAQAGLFTYLRDPGLVPVDEFLEATWARTPELEKHFPLPWMRKLTLPSSCAVDLLRLLSYSGVHGASMYPGYEGVVRQLRETALWAARSP